MADEHKLHQDASKAARAQALLSNELYLESYSALEAQLVEGWIASDPRDTEFRERIFTALHANRKQRDYFVSVVNNGKLAAVELKQLAEAAHRGRRFGII